MEKKLKYIIDSIPDFEIRLKAGKRILKKLEKYTATIEKIEKKVFTGGEGLTAQLEEAKRINKEIAAYYTEASENLSTLKETVKSIDLLKEAFETSLETTNTLISNVNDPETGIQSKLNAANEDKNETRSILLSAENTKKELDTKVESIQGQLQEMEQLYDDFIEIKTKIDDPTNGLIKVLSSSTAKRDEIFAIKKKADTLFADILKTRDESVAFTTEIKKYKDETELNTEIIRAYAKESEENNSKIAQIYDIATGRGLAGSFDKRKKELLLSVWIWGAVLVVSVASYVFVLMWIYHETFQKGIPNIDVAAWYRLTLTLPILGLIAFAAYQYSRERNFLEKYAFKSATAVALESYTKLLTDKFSMHETKIVRFVLNAMTMIYREPHDIEKKYKFNFGINKIFNLGVEEDKMEEITDFIEKSVDDAVDIKNEKNKGKPTR